MTGRVGMQSVNRLVVALAAMCIFCTSAVAQSQEPPDVQQNVQQDRQTQQQEQAIQTGMRWPGSFRDWWQTPEQQAELAWRKGNNEALSEIAPDEEWQAVSDYLNGDYESAKSAFGQAASAVNNADALRAMFNEATSAIQLGEYPQAIAQLEAVLSEQPENTEAARNKAIAERLLELSQQDQQQQSSGGSDQSGQSENNEQSGEQNNSSSDPSSQGSDTNQNQDGSQQDQSSASDDAPSQSSNQDSDQGANTDAEAEPDITESASPEQQQAEIDAAREALEQARQNAQAEQAQPDTDSPQPVNGGDEPISEEGQATEQWLRQIPDDPDDLLRRKLLQNHRNEYPDVQVRGRGY